MVGDLLALPQRTFWGGNSNVDLRFMASSSLVFAVLLGGGHVGRGLVAVWRTVDLGRILRTRAVWLDAFVLVFNTVALGSVLVAAKRVSPRATGVGETVGSAFAFWTDRPVLGHAVAVATATVLLLLLLDLSIYIVHVLMHRVPFLWAFHKAHHSATELYPLTVFRFHPVELVLIALFSPLFVSFGAGVINRLGGPGISTLRILSINAGLGVIFLSGSVYRHSRLWVTFPGPLRGVIHSPAHHQLHHSDDPADFNGNYSSSLLIWDRLFGTLVDPAGREPPARFGLDDKAVERAHANPVGFYTYPVVDAVKSLLPSRGATGAREPRPRL